MTERISLVEAYNNRDVIAQLVRLRDNVDELMNILKDLDPNGDLTNVVTKTGDQTIDGVKTFIGQIVADCDIIQNGAAYETHAEQVYSVNDYIVTRDGQITGLAPGDLSGFHVKKYNGVDDSRLGVDNTGTMRVGDVGSEEPLMTRDEAANLTSGDVLLWDGVNQRAIGQDKTSFLSVITNKVFTNTGTISVASATSEKAGEITVTEDGTYIVIVEYAWTSNNTGSRWFGHNLNGTQKWLSQSAGNETSNMTATEVLTLQSGDVIAGWGYQNSGSTLNLTGKITLVKLL